MDTSIGPRAASLTRWIDPSIGTDAPGCCLIGPYLPLGIVRLGPDMVPPQPTHGYERGKPICRFSHTHVSGTGGVGRYGNIGVWPFVGAARWHADPQPPVDEQAACGRYAVTLGDTGIRAELTATARVGVHRYQFPSGRGHVLIDTGAVVQPSFAGPQLDPNGWPPQATGGYVEWVGAREVCGRFEGAGGWGHPYPYTVHFFARFDRAPDERGVATAHAPVSRSTWADGAGCRALATFADAGEVVLRVGISYASLAHARASVDREVGDAPFDEIARRADASWASWCDRLRVEGGTDGERTLFYSLLTRLLCMPSDLGVDDEFAQWRSGVRHFTDYMCLWDSVRNANSFIALFAPELAVDQLNCLLDIADKTGWLPDAWIAGHRAMAQGGSSADILLCEAALKGLTGIDYAKALTHVRRNAEQASPDPYACGRYPSYRRLGFLDASTPQSVSRHLEYAYQDWCIARLAEHVGDRDLAERQHRAAGNLWNLWRDDVKSFAPRHEDGSWQAGFDPEFARWDCWNDPVCYEGSARQWSFQAYQDFPGLVARHGGAEAFVAHLDGFFARIDQQPRGDRGPMMRWDFYGSKETMLHIPYLYLYAGRPDRTQERVAWAMDRFFAPRRDGLHDNEDMGCQSTFWMCGALGLYPVMGQDLWWLTTPRFSRSEIAVGDGRTLTIHAPGAGPGRRYLAGATLDGRPLDRAWVRHAEIARGGELRFDLSATPTTWGAGRPAPGATRA